MATSKLDVIIDVSVTGARSLKALTGDLGDLGIKAAGIAAGGLLTLGAGLGVLSTKLITAGSDAQEMQGKFDAVFREFGGAVTDDLSAFGEAVGRSRFELMGFASTIQDTLVPLGFARGAAADMSVEVVKLATDLGSFNNLPTEQVVMDIQSALVGNTETLRKYGVVASQAAIEQFALNEGIWNGEGAMDAQTKAAAIMGLIIDGTTDAQGDAARTSESWANQMRALKATFTDAAAEIGLKLLPAVTPLLSKLGEFAQDKLPALIAAMQPFIDMLVEVGQLLANGDIEGALTRAFGSEMAEKIMGLASAFSEFVTETLIPFVDEHGPAIQNAFLAIAAVITASAIGSLIMALFNPLTLVLAGVALLAVAWTENWGDIQGKTEKFRNWFVDEGIPNILTALTAIQLTIPVVVDFWNVQWEKALLGFKFFVGMFKVQWDITFANLEIAKQKLVAFKDFLNLAVWGPMMVAVQSVLTLVNALISALGSAAGLLNNLPAFGDGGASIPGGITSGGGGTPSNSQSSNSGTTINHNYNMTVNGGDTGGVATEFGAMAAAAGAT